MTTPTKSVHRLVDMVVEEVSLVDRAANKHRFLIVKRDDPMADKSTKAKKPPAKPKTDGVEEEVQDSAAAKAVGKTINDALAIASSALEVLTDAVDKLSQLDDDSEAASIATGLSEQLSTVAGELASSAGLEAPAEDGSNVDQVVEGVRTMLSQVSEMLSSSSSKSDPAPEAAPSATESPAEPASPADPGAVTKQLTEIATCVRSIAETIKDQGQRLGRLEKGVGLPNSRSAPERPAREPKEVSWPLDMNRPMDRESVDKAVSFHDR